MRGKVAEVFAECFMEDHLYQYIFPEEQVRQKVLIIFFRAYIDLWGKYGEMIATSLDLEGIAYIYDNSLFKGGTRYKLEECWYQIKTLKMLRYINMKQWCQFHRTLAYMSSDWILNHIQQDYIHLDLISVHKDYRGKGLAKGLIQYAKHCAREREIPLTLETQNPQNCELYTHLGFKTCKVYSYKKLTQYCMVYGLKKNNR